MTGTPLENGLTIKQEAFAVGYFQSANAAQAYRDAYDVEPNNQKNWVYVEAHKLLRKPKIAQRVQELREEANDLAVFTRLRAMEELEQARVLAHGEGQASAAVGAVSAKIKLSGFDQPQQIEVTGKDGGPIETSSATASDMDRATADLLREWKEDGTLAKVLGGTPED